MSAPVDVLAVSPLRAIDGADAAISTAGLGPDDILRVELREARAAIEELVEAAKRVESDNHGHGFTTPETLDALSAALAKFGEG